LKKPSRKEVKAASAFCIFLLTGVIIVNAISQHRTYTNTDIMRPSTSSTQFSRELVEQYGLSGNTQTATVADERIKDVRQSINGELNKGTFEEVVLKIEDETDALGGYVESEDVVFTDDIWSGELLTKIPQNNSLDFVFTVRSLISKNGRVISIAASIRDITPTSGTATQEPLAQIRTTLKEISDKPWQLTLPTSPLLAGILPVLSTFFTWIAVGMAIGIPAFFTMLGIVLLIDRALKPAANRLFKKN
jgi:hypothetical protein